jgi:hypothetical protein
LYIAPVVLLVVAGVEVGRVGRVCACPGNLLVCVCVCVCVCNDHVSVACVLTTKSGVLWCVRCAWSSAARGHRAPRRGVGVRVCLARFGVRLLACLLACLLARMAWHGLKASLLAAPARALCVCQERVLQAGQRLAASSAHSICCQSS